LKAWKRIFSSLSRYAMCASFYWHVQSLSNSFFVFMCRCMSILTRA
jgi:hypothetical protein